MLFLDRIEILGFKSFCDKTLLKVPEGITAIVGPNGCGKSNVVDALNWVLGEQSAKSLRSDKMEEVIFNGSRNRKPLGMAQVTLFWRSERENPAAGEVSIARRLFRSGESQYEMNGDICRLKDIHQFFLNEGFDPLAYSILEQGKIESFFSSKPMERRALIEEVAGVAEFKHKKRAAQLKLAENQLQLERIQDILQEVEKQLSSLKRQAARARRHQILKEERKVLQQISYYRRFHQVQEDFRQMEEQLRQHAEAEEEAFQSLQQKELVLSDLKLRFADLESKLYQDQARLHQLEMQIQENQSALVSKTEHTQRLTRMIEEKEEQNARLIEEEKQLRSDHEARTAEQIELDQQLQQLGTTRDALVSQLAETTNQVEAMENAIQQFRNEIVELLHNTSHLKSEQTRLMSQHEHLSETIKRKEGESITAKERHTAHAESLSRDRSGLEKINEEIGYLDQTETDILRQCEELKVDWDALQAQVQKAFQEQTDLQREFHKLEAQQHSSKFYNESAKNLLNLPTRRALGMMMDFIETAPQYETAIEHFLADKLNYLIVNEEDSALASIDYLKRQGLGYCGFIIKNGHHPEAVILPEDLRSESGVIGSLQEIVRIKEEALPAIAPFLKSAVVVDNLDCAQVLIKKYPEYQFVTVQGDVILSPALYAGGAKADDIPGLMAIQREQKELTQQLEIATFNIQALDGQVRSIQDRLDTSNRELTRLNDVRESKKKDRLLVQVNCEQIEKELSREGKLMEILDQEILQLNNEREAVQARTDQFVLELEQQTAKREAREKERTETEEKLSTVKEEQNLLRSQTHEMQIQIAQLSERNKSLLMDIERLNQQRETVQSNIHENSNLVFQKKVEISETEDSCSRLQTSLLETVRAHDDQKESMKRQEKQKEDLVGEIELQEGVVAEARARRDQTREQRSNIEVEKARVEQQRHDLISRCNEEMGFDLESLQLAESDWNDVADEDLKNKLLETEAKLERLGSINMLALEEYGAMEERHKFLKTQYDDLKASIENLLDTIQRIDATSLKRFQEAFEGVQAHFQDLFQRLFNGGKAEMVLSDTENPGESGIEIHVQPPGKRLQNMNLMSGGEKTLTGIAFLMALFQYHASPFCVMDEVDAALDEVNVQRFTSLIADAKKQVQFLIVTHNKRTMEAADQLYGVTMGEPGVSTILSAKFEEAEALIDA